MYYLGYDIGGTKCAVCLGEDQGGSMHILAKEKIPTAGDPTAMLDTLSARALSLAESCGISMEQIRAAGISCGGPLSSSRGVILSPPNLPGWDEIHAVRHLRRLLNIPVYLENDANACAVAEWKYGGGRGVQNMVFLTFGTGLGAGLILDGRLYRGRSDSAGEIGHVRLSESGPVGFGKAGSCEGWCSGGGIARLGRMRAEEDPEGSGRLREAAGTPEGITAALIAALAGEGDEFCRAIYRESGEKLGRTVAILSDVLDVERVVIGSIFARAEGLLRPSMEAVLREEALTVPEVVPAQLGEAIGDVAALAVAADQTAESAFR